MSADGRSWSYRAVHRRLGQYSGALRRLGLGDSSVVAVFGYPRPECFLLFLACCNVGAVFLGLNPKYTSRELALVCEDASPRALFVMIDPYDEEQMAKVKALSGVISSVQHLVVRAPVIGMDGSGSTTLPPRRTWQLGAADPGSPCAVVYTSGSTGSPKGALISQAGLLRSAMLSWNYWYGALRDIRTVVQHPINHVAWLTCECVTPMVAGGTLFFRERFDGPGTLSYREGTSEPVVDNFPWMVAIAMKSAASPRPIYPHCSGLPFDLSVSRDYERAAAAYGRGAVHQLWPDRGEWRSCDSHRPGDALDLVASSVGRVVSGIEVRVVGGEGRDAPERTGPFLIRDSCVFSGYLGRAAEHRSCLEQDGWLHAGDIVTRDASGIVRLIGRKREMFKSGGYNVYPS